MAGLGFASDYASGDYGSDLPAPALTPTAQAIPQAPVAAPDLPAAPRAAPRPAIPQWDNDPIGAIGFVLQSVAAGAQGKELPADRVMKQQLQYDEARAKHLTIGIEALDHGFKIMSTLPAADQAGFMKGYLTNFEPMFPGIGETGQKLAATAGGASILKELPQYAEFLVGKTPDQIMALVGNKEKRAVLDDLVDAKHGPRTVANLGSWEAAINTALPGKLETFRNAKTGLLDIPQAALQRLDAMVAQKDPRMALGAGGLAYISRHRSELGFGEESLPSEQAKAAAVAPLHLIQSTSDTGQKQVVGVPTQGPQAGSAQTLAPIGTSDQNIVPTGPESLRGAEYLAAIPANRAALVKGYSEGRVAFPGSFSLRSPYWQKMVADILQYDPGFDAVNFNARATTRKDFTSGKSAQNITSFNTAIGHLGTLYQAAQGLDNGPIPAWNRFANWLQSNTGDPRVVKFNTARDAVAAELTRAFRGTGGSLTEVQGWEKTLNSANSPDQLRGAIQQAVDLLGSRIGAENEKYKRGMGTTADVTDLLSSGAKKTLAMLPGGEGLLPSGMTAPPATAAPQPVQTPQPQSEAEYNALPSGAIYTKNGKTYRKP